MRFAKEDRRFRCGERSDHRSGYFKAYLRKSDRPYRLPLPANHARHGSRSERSRDTESIRCCRLYAPGRDEAAELANLSRPGSERSSPSPPGTGTWRWRTLLEFAGSVLNGNVPKRAVQISWHLKPRSIATGNFV